MIFSTFSGWFRNFGKIFGSNGKSFAKVESEKKMTSFRTIFDRRHCSTFVKVEIPKISGKRMALAQTLYPKVNKIWLFFFQAISHTVCPSLICDLCPSKTIGESKLFDSLENFKRHQVNSNHYQQLKIMLNIFWIISHSVHIK